MKQLYPFFIKYLLILEHFIEKIINITYFSLNLVSFSGLSIIGFVEQWA